MTFFILFILLITKVKAIDLKSNNVVLYNLNDNQIVYQKNKDEKTSIASLTKIMTVLVSLEKISNLDERFIITKDMLKGLKEQDAYQMGLTNGKIVSYRDLLYATILASAGDAAQGLAIQTFGSLNECVKAMNDKAENLKLYHLHFQNVVGLDNAANYGTVDEIAILLKEALKNPIFKEIFFTKTYIFHDHSFEVKSTLYNSSLKLNLKTNYILGAKTGYTFDAGRCLASVAYDEVNNIFYLLVTTNAEAKSSNHILDAVNLYTYYFEHYRYINLVKKNTLIANYQILGKNIPIYLDHDIKYYTDKDFAKENLEVTFQKRPFEINDYYLNGDVTIKYDGKIIETFTVTIKDRFGKIIFEYITLALSLLVFLISLVFLSKEYKNRKRKVNLYTK